MSATSQKRLNKFLLLFLLFPIGLLVYLVFQNLRKATPKNSLWLLLSKYGKYAGWIEAQARHESANYTSQVYKRANNPFGMKNPSKRKSLGYVVQGDPYRHYKNIGEAIRDYVLYLEYFKVPTNINSAKSYFALLQDQGYAEDPLYEEKILKYV